jgi:hypothetical protein
MDDHHRDTRRQVEARRVQVGHASIGQALRINADTSRAKPRQRAEERSVKVSVKIYRAFFAAGL